MKLQLFFKGEKLRMAGTAAESMWGGKDVCDILGIRNSRDALARLPADEKGVVITDTPGGSQKLVFVTLPGLCRLVFLSRKPEAEAFKTWVFHRVLPAVIMNGSFIPERDDHPTDLLALPPERRDHFILWLAIVNEVASVEKHRPKIIELSRRHGIPVPTIYRRFRHWRQSGGSWRSLDARTK